MKIIKYFIFFSISFFIFSCKEGCKDSNALNYDPSAEKENGSCEYSKAALITLVIPDNFNTFLPSPKIPNDNPLTNKGVLLGKKLFYDPILSSDSSISCSSCHKPDNAFADNVNISLGVKGRKSNRNSMPLFNLAWHTQGFFWDGRSPTLEKQIFHPVTDSKEMNETWSHVVKKLNNTNAYPALFREAFNQDLKDSIMVSKAIAQFLRTIISANSKLDRHFNKGEPLSIEESRGLQIFNSERAECFHCHGSFRNPLYLKKSYESNGLDTFMVDKGRYVITKNLLDISAFKVPSIRNLSFTAPYMHDGRFATLEEVINHYSDFLIFKNVPTGVHRLKNGGLKLSQQEKNDLIAFLKTLNDSSFVKNKKFRP